MVEKVDRCREECGGGLKAARCREKFFYANSMDVSMDKKLLSLLEESLASLPHNNLALAFSGGVDSTILAKLLEGRCRLYAVGTPDSPDMREATRLADSNGWDILPIILAKEDVDRLLPIIVPVLRDPGPMTFNFHVPLFLAAESATERMVVAGHGADELFGGYKRYGKMEEQEFARETKKDALALGDGDVCDARKLVSSTGHLLSTPFLHPALMEYAFTMGRLDRTDKMALRVLARELGVGSWNRDKKAAQFGSGASKLLRDVARDRDLDEKELIRAHSP